MQAIMMERKDDEKNGPNFGKDLLRHMILAYWSLFWLFNIVDKVIGGAHFLFVGKDRFAQIQRFFDSIGLGDPIISNLALILTIFFETFAFIGFFGAWIHLCRKNEEAARSWLFVGIVLSMVTFTYFTVGDQVFGDHFELLEHSTFWFITILSWIIYIRAQRFQWVENLKIPKQSIRLAFFIAMALVLITTLSIMYHNKVGFIERSQAVDAVKITSNKYKIEFPFLAGSKAFEKSIEKFMKDRPSEKIKFIYTAPMPLRLGTADGLIIYLQTEKK
jgi:hypothetical protein